MTYFCCLASVWLCQTKENALHIEGVQLLYFKFTYDVSVDRLQQKESHQRDGKLEHFYFKKDSNAHMGVPYFSFSMIYILYYIAREVISLTLIVKLPKVLWFRVEYFHFKLHFLYIWIVLLSIKKQANKKRSKMPFRNSSLCGFAITLHPVFSFCLMTIHSRILLALNLD